MKLGMDWQILWHLPVLAAVDRLSLVSTIFAHSGNPLTIKAPFHDGIPISTAHFLCGFATSTHRPAGLYRHTAMCAIGETDSTICTSNSRFRAVIRIWQG